MRGKLVGLSSGTDPSALSRSILPNRVARLCALAPFAFSPTATYNRPAVRTERDRTAIVVGPAGKALERQDRRGALGHRGVVADREPGNSVVRPAGRRRRDRRHGVVEVDVAVGDEVRVERYAQEAALAARIDAQAGKQVVCRLPRVTSRAVPPCSVIPAARRVRRPARWGTAAALLVGAAAWTPVPPAEAATPICPASASAELRMSRAGRAGEVADDQESDVTSGPRYACEGDWQCWLARS